MSDPIEAAGAPVAPGACERLERAEKGVPPPPELHEARKALACLYIAVEPDVAVDVQRKVEAAFKALQGVPPPPAGVQALIAKWLAKNEWTPDAEGEPFCWLCSRAQSQGHDADCGMLELAALIAPPAGVQALIAQWRERKAYYKEHAHLRERYIELAACLRQLEYALAPEIEHDEAALTGRPGQEP